MRQQTKCHLTCFFYDVAQFVQHQLWPNQLKGAISFSQGMGLTKGSLITFFNSNILDIRCGDIILTFIVSSEWSVFVRRFDFALSKSVSYLLLW